MVSRTDKSIAERVSLSRRYVRSTDVARDLSDPSALEGYVVTASARSALQRLTAGLSDTSTQRAFRITGPYGSGKSSFALLLCRLAMGGDSSLAVNIAVSANGDDAAHFPAHDVVVMTGRRTSFARDLLLAIDARATEAGLADVAAAAASGMELDDAGVVAASAIGCLEQLAAATFAASGRRTLLLVDEMGRYVEHAAANPRSEDPSIFQRVAECAGGSTGAPLAVVGILHHRFGEYVATLGNFAEAEWTRSADRYEEIPFGDSLEQTLYLMAGALRVSPAHTRAVASASAAVYAKAREFGALGSGTEEIGKVAPNLYPLHPAALAALAVAARRVGQNERSIFGFLQTLEPGGFQRFIQDTRYGPDEWYRLPQLFDYFAAQETVRFGSADRERRWHLALDAVAQVDRAGDQADVLRCVALMAVLEPIQTLGAEPATLAWSLGIAEDRVEAALGELVSKGLLYRRPQSGDYSLWSRTSVDLDQWLEDAGIRVPAADRLDQAMATLPSPRPLVAHAHYQKSGTLRAFAIVLRSAVDETPIAIPAGYDGVVAVLAAHPQDDLDQVIERASYLSRDAGARALVHVHRVSPSDLEWATRLRRWLWVRDNCPELRVDDLARAEVGARVAQAEAALAEAFAALVAPEGDDWLQDGEIITISGRAALSRRISQTCDDTFFSSPVLRNELVNRSKLSTAVASARMRLLETMLEHEREPMLGLTGAPPERTIHLAMFQASGMHRELEPGVWGFAPPEADELRWRPVWDRLEEILQADVPISFDRIGELLAEAPWGLRAGPSLLLVTAYMLHHRSRVALMERKSFVPEITAAHFMRLAKNPSNFALRAIDGDDKRSEVLERLASAVVLPPEIPSPAAEVKAIVATLYRWFGRLPENALVTENLPPVAKRVRATLSKARDPLDIVFVQLPRACNAIAENGQIDADAYAEQLSAALEQIGDVHPTLQRLAAASLASAFGQRDAEGVRLRIQVEFAALRGELTDYPLRQFVDRALGSDQADDRWLDGIAGLIAGRRIENWDDTSLDTFSFAARDMAGRLSRWLFLKERAVKKHTQMVSLHLLTTTGDEKAVVIDSSRVDAEQVAKVRSMLANIDNPQALLAQLLAEMIETTEAKTKA